jgi:hypothetical protein
MNQTETVPVVKNTDMETNTHKPTVKPRLPKYDSQSETTNDTCLWLRTILGRNRNQHRNTKHRLPTPTHALTILNKDKTRENKGQNVTLSVPALTHLDCLRLLDGNEVNRQWLKWLRSLFVCVGVQGKGLIRERCSTGLCLTTRGY